MRLPWTLWTLRPGTWASECREAMTLDQPLLVFSSCPTWAADFFEVNWAFFLCMFRVVLPKKMKKYEVQQYWHDLKCTYQSRSHIAVAHQSPHTAFTSEIQSSPAVRSQTRAKGGKHPSLSWKNSRNEKRFFQYLPVKGVSSNSSINQPTNWEKDIYGFFMILLWFEPPWRVNPSEDLTERQLWSLILAGQTPKTMMNGSLKWRSPLRSLWFVSKWDIQPMRPLLLLFWSRFLIVLVGSVVNPPDKDKQIQIESQFLVLVWKYNTPKNQWLIMVAHHIPEKEHRIWWVALPFVRCTSKCCATASLQGSSNSALRSP